jgi:hypothetical protein
MQMATTWEMLYPNPNPKHVEYTHSIVSYLDILGFRGLVKTKSAGEISRILRILAESARPDSLSKSTKTQFTRFSDTVIRSTPQRKHYPHNFIFELRSLVYVQMALIPLGITIRGTVTVGDIVQSWGVVYGPAVVRAYDLESQAGGPPRIIVDDAALNLLRPDIEKEQLQSELDFLIKEDGSTFYLDYLKACERELNVPEQEYSIFLGHHRDLIRVGLKEYANKPSIVSKYVWLKDYHERTLQERFGAMIPPHLNV